MQFVRSIIILTFFVFGSPVFSDQNISEEIRQIDANIVFVRHALAPGFGDPKSFKLDNCNTQRNLSDEGKKQAKSIGNYFNDQEIIFSEILTSEWCRCMDTVKEMALGKWSKFSGLNSFFQDHYKKSEVLDLFYSRLKSSKQEGVTLMVTHQVVILEITGIYTSSGEIVIYNTEKNLAKKINIDYKKYELQ